MNPAPPRLLCRVFAMVCMAALSLPASADNITMKQNNLRFTNVQITGIQNGELVYRTAAGGQRQQVLSDIALIDLVAHPALAEIQTALAEGVDRRQALTLARSAEQELQRATTPISQLLLNWARSQAYDAAGDARRAADAWVAMAQAGAEAALLTSTTPVSFGRVTEAQRPALLRRLQQAQRQVPAPARTAIRQAIQGLQPDEAAPDNAPTNGPTNGSNPSPSGQPASNADNPADDGALLPSTISADDPTWAMLDAGDVAGALAQAQARVTSPRELSKSLYLLGRCQLALAEQSGQESDYKTAGLTFMRVIVHYGRLGNPTVAAALTEAGFVHAQINRPDVAAKLYQQALALFDEERDPAYLARLAELRRALNPTP